MINWLKYEKFRIFLRLDNEIEFMCMTKSHSILGLRMLLSTAFKRISLRRLIVIKNQDPLNTRSYPSSGHYVGAVWPLIWR